MSSSIRHVTDRSLLRGDENDLRPGLGALGRHARDAARKVALATPQEKDAALLAMAASVRETMPAILAANTEDMAQARHEAATGAFLDRLRLDETRVLAIARAIEEIAAFPDPVGRVTARFERPNGLVIERVATPLGVVGVIYESRPNVTADAGALCLKSGNASILRAGSASFHSVRGDPRRSGRGPRAGGAAATAAISWRLPRARDAVGEMLSGLDGTIDVIVPRGGKSLVERVQNEARVPVFAHLEGVCMSMCDAAADLDMARRILINAKLRRTGVCGAAETLLVDHAVARDPSCASGDGASRCRLRRARRCGHARGRFARDKPRARKIGAPNISTPSSRAAWSTGSTRRSSTSSPTARTTPTPS